MQLYFCHSTESSDFNFVRDYYEPLQKSPLAKDHELIFPHQPGAAQFDTHKIIKGADIIFAETSYESTSLGIELGWASAAFQPVVCLYKAGTKVSSSINSVSKFLIEYKDSKDLVDKVQDFVSRIKFE